MEPRPQTLGEYRVGLDFNPSGNEEVNELKRIAAGLIDKCGASDQGASELKHLVTKFSDKCRAGIKAALPHESGGSVDLRVEKVRLYNRALAQVEKAARQFEDAERQIALAAEQFEDAAMVAVKAATKRERK